MTVLTAWRGEALEGSWAPANGVVWRGDVVFYQSPPQFSSEDDWTLPETSFRKSRFNLIRVATGPDASSSSTAFITTWADIEATEGVYDWSALNAALDAGPTWVRIYASETMHCPAWLATKYPALASNAWAWGGVPWNDLLGHSAPGTFYEIWDPNFEAEFRELLTALGSLRIGAHPNFRGLYFPHGWRWNEFSLKWNNTMDGAGFTPAEYLAWWQRTVDDYVVAVGGSAYAKKLLYTGYPSREWIQGGAGSAAWEAAINTGDHGNKLVEYAIVTKGTGGRCGYGEGWYSLVDRPGYGLGKVTAGSYDYVTKDDAHPAQNIGNGYLGDEIESFSGLCRGMQGYYPNMMAVLASIADGKNWWFLGYYEPLETFYEYFLKTAGSTKLDAIDCFARLCEFRDTQERAVFGSTTSFRNIENWLHQRDVVGDGETVRCDPVRYDADWWTARGHTFWNALRTDHASGNDYIYFTCGLEGPLCDVTAYVTWFDRDAISWDLEYENANGAQSVTVDGSGTGRWMTTEISLGDVYLTGAFNDYHMRLYNGGSEDLCVRMVRLTFASRGTRTSSVALAVAGIASPGFVSPLARRRRR